MPVSRKTAESLHAAATVALNAKAIDQSTFDALTDGHITASESASATWVMAKKSLFGGANKKAAATQLSRAITAHMAEQDG
jgi:hypothetical protein